MSRARAVAWVLVALAAVGVAPVAAATGLPESGGAVASDRPAGAAPTGSDDVVQTVTYERIPDEPGVILARHRYRVATNVSALVVYDYPRGEVVGSRGFDEQPNGRWTWDGRTAEPSLTLRMAINRSSPTFRGHDWVDTGEWALADPQRAFAYRTASTNGWRYSWNETAPLTRRTATAGEGYAGGSTVFLGDHETVTSRVDGQTLRVVRPDGAENVSAAAVLDALGGAAERLRVGARADAVTVFVGPEPLRQGGVAAATAGETRDVWVSETADVGAPTNAWIHEYVHTRQNATLAPGMSWFREASASYYAGVLSVHQGLGGGDGAERFAARLRGEESADAVLADRSSWSTPMVPYTKGQRVLAALDARIRTATGGNRTLQDVFRRMNGRDGAVTVDGFADVLANVTGRSQRAWVDAHVAGGEPASPPNASVAGVEVGNGSWRAGGEAPLRPGSRTFVAPPSGTGGVHG